MTAEIFNAYILAGGSSRRMGFDKLLLHIDGQSLLEKAIASCNPCFKKVKLVAGKLEQLSPMNNEVVLDSPRARGPMAGVIAALEDCDSDICFITAVDLPDLSSKIINSIIDRYRGQQYLGLLEPGGLQPLCGLYHKSALEALYRHADNGEFSMTEAVKTLNYDVINVPSDRWRNLNYPEDILVED